MSYISFGDIFLMGSTIHKYLENYTICLNIKSYIYVNFWGLEKGPIPQILVVAGERANTPNIGNGRRKGQYILPVLLGVCYQVGCLLPCWVSVTLLGVCYPVVYYVTRAPEPPRRRRRRRRQNPPALSQPLPITGRDEISRSGKPSLR